MIPAAMGSHHVGPEGETGLGPSDVTNEPSTTADTAGDAGNGFAACGTPTSCGGPSTPLSEGTLVLDGDVSQGTYPYFVDINSILREASDQTDAETGEYIYPGFNFFAAWFGWWTDQGRGEALQEVGTIPGVADDTPDGAINDGHDDHASHGDTRHTGPWDEFVWRGKNPWAGQHGYDSHPDDQMRTFVHPGTHETGPAGGTLGDGSGSIQNEVGTPGLLIVTDQDHPQKPDFLMDDRTAQTVESPPGVSHNNQGYGWINGIGWYEFMYDQSFVMATEVTYSVNPDAVGQGLFDPDSGVREDTDLYNALHPALETAYRTAVWDPGGPGDDGDENLDVVHENGTKQFLKETYTEDVQPLYTTADEVINQVTAPAAQAQGAANDAVRAPRPHEPDLPGQDYNGQASYGDDTYGGFGETYYTPGTDRGYDGFKSDYQPWIDMRPWVAGAQFQVQLRGDDAFNVYPVNNEKADRTQTPSILFLDGNAGAWWDATDDDWVGNLDEEGRQTSGDDPYNSGNVDDPNDYTDTPANHGSDPAKDGWTAEWKPGTGATTVSATLRPLCEPAEENADGECPWGSTDPPVGVYVLRDEDGNQFNPYDEMVEDAAGVPCTTPSVGQVNCDEDGRQLSQHVQYGPIQVAFQHSGGDTGEFEMEENIVLPEGSMNYDIRVEATADLEPTITQRDGSELVSSTVTDVDVLEASDLTTS